MASQDLSNAKTTILRATPGAIPGIHGNTHERFPSALAISERFFKNWGGSRAPDVSKKASPKRKSHQISDNPLDGRLSLENPAGVPVAIAAEKATYLLEGKELGP